MKKSTSIYALLCIFLYPSHNICMESAIVPMITDSESLVLDVVLAHTIQRDNHNTIVACGSTQKKWHHFLRTTAPDRKKHLIQLAEQNNRPGSSILEPVAWHQYGSACGKRFIKCGSLTGEKLVLNYWFLADGKATFHQSNGWDNFDECVSCSRQVRFTPDGPLGFYGWHEDKHYKLWCATNQLIEYCLSQHGVSLYRKCGIDIRGNNSNRSLSFFKRLPVLLKAFLDSPVIDEYGNIKLHALQNVKIPENYREYECLMSNPAQDPFDDLPIDIKEAILARYATQNNESTEK